MAVVDPHSHTIWRPRIIAEAVAALTECLCEMVASEGGGPVCWCGVWPGQQTPWAYCSECAGDVCGMAWVRPSDIFPYNTFPTPVLTPNCQAPLAWRFELGVIRCIPVPADGNLPDPDTMMEVAQRQMADAWAMYLTLQCCDVKNIAPEGYTALGPQGDCVGGIWTAYIDQDEFHHGIQG